MSIFDFIIKDNLNKVSLSWKGEPPNFKVSTLKEIREARKKGLVAVVKCARHYGY